MVHSFGGHTEQDIKRVPGNLFHTVKISIIIIIVHR